MIKKFLKSLEDPQRSLLGPNYWLLCQIGLILPLNRISKFTYIIIHLIATYFVFSQYIELYSTKSDLDLVLTNLKISMLSTVCVMKANTAVIWQDHWRQVIDYVTEADQFESNNHSPAKCVIIDRYTRYSRRVTYLYWILVTMTVVTVTTTPLLIYLTMPQAERGDSFIHMFSTWMPFDKHQSPGCWITVFWHILICLYGAMVVAAYDSTSIVIMVFFSGKLELLRERSMELFGISQQRAIDEEVNSAIQQLYTIHVTLTKHLKIFNSLLSPVMFLYVVMCSLMLCASAFQLTNAQNTTQKILMAEYLVFGIAQLFMYCWHSNDVLAKSESLMFGPYESDWYTGNHRQQKNVLLLARQFSQTFIFQAGPFMKLTLPAFITILKGAYSYYTLLQKI